MEDLPSGPTLSEEGFLFFQVDSVFEKLTKFLRNVNPYFQRLEEHLITSRSPLWLDICFV